MRVPENGRSLPPMVAKNLAARLPEAEATANAIAHVEATLRQHRRDGGRTHRQMLSDEHAALLASAAQRWLDIAYVIPAHMNPPEYQEIVPYGDIVATYRRLAGCTEAEAIQAVRRACDRTGIIPTFGRPRGRQLVLTVDAGERRQIWLAIGMPEEVTDDVEARRA